MKILLPTDFSKPSIIPIYYAAKLARKIGAEIVLFHAVRLDAISSSQTTLLTSQLLDAMTESAKEDLTDMANKLKQDVGDDLKVSWHAMKEHSLEYAVESFATQNGIDLIVMGTKGASGLLKVLMGSNTAAMIGASSIPVIAVPEDTYFENIHKIVYASDLLDAEKELETLIGLARVFNASIHLLHILPPESVEKIDSQKIQNDLIQKHQYPEISVNTVVNEDVGAAIDAFITAIDADLLAMFTHKPTFFEKLFGKSVTREMAFHSKIPLLSIKKQH